MKSNDIHGVVTARIRALRILATVLVGAFAILCIFPFVWMISTSFKYEIDVMELDDLHIIQIRNRCNGIPDPYHPDKGEYRQLFICLDPERFPALLP